MSNSASIEESQSAGSADGPDDRSSIQRVSVNGIEIAYETFGDPSNPPMLLVMGLGTQMLAWPDEMCQALADAGHFVIRYDNRDVGLSTHIDAPVPSTRDLLMRRKVAYTLSDMASDGVGLIDALELERVHLVGASMGGMISQTVAIEHPHRVESLTLIMTTSGSRRVGQPTPRIIQRMAKRPLATSREEAVQQTVDTYRVIGSPGHIDEDRVRDLAGRAYDRSYDPGGAQRQLAAIMAQPNRTAALARLDVPSLVVHGLEDPLVSASGGLALAKAIPGARFVGYQGMGHDLPATMAEPIVDEVLDLVARTA